MLEYKRRIMKNTLSENVIFTPSGGESKTRDIFRKIVPSEKVRQNIRILVHKTLGNSGINFLGYDVKKDS